MRTPLLCLFVLFAAACSSTDSGNSSESGGSAGATGGTKGTGGSKATGGSGGKAAGGSSAAGGNKAGGAGNAEAGAGTKDSGVADSGNGKWVATWATGLQETEAWNRPKESTATDAGIYDLTDSTLRQFVHVSLGGTQVRLKLSNEYGDTPVTMDSVHLAASKGADGGIPDGTIDTATDTAVKFNGSASVTIEAGKHVTSDPLDFSVAALSNVAISVHISAISMEKVTGHPGSRTDSYYTKGNVVAQGSLAGALTAARWYLIEGIDVMADQNAAAAIILGDSISDGRGSTTNYNNRWPDVFAKRLHDNASTSKIAMVNMGIGGNAVYNGGLGPSGKTRFQHDILDQPGAKWVIVAEGVNDIGNASTSTLAPEGGTAEAGTDAGKKDGSVEAASDAAPATPASIGPTPAEVADGLIAAYQELITKAHAKNLKIYGVPIPPIGETTYYNLDAGLPSDVLPAREAAREKVNAWIKAAGHFDAVMDLAADITDTAPTPQRMLPDYWMSDGDRLHPNPLGHQKMGEACDLSLFTTNP